MDSALSHSLASEDSDNELLEQRWPVKGLMYRHWKGCGTMQPSVQCMLALRSWSIIAALLRLISEDWDYAGVQRTKNDGIDVNMFLGTTMKRTKDIDGCNSQKGQERKWLFNSFQSHDILYSWAIRQLDSDMQGIQPVGPYCFCDHFDVKSC